MMPTWEAIAASLIVLGTIAVSAIFGYRQYRQLGLPNSDPDSEDQRFHHRTARRRLLISVMLGFVGIGIGMLYVTGLEKSVRAIGEVHAREALTPEQRQTVKLYSWSWVAILLLLLGIVIAVGFDLLDVRRHWRTSLQRIRDDRREMMDEQLAKLRAEHRGARIDPSLN